MIVKRWSNTVQPHCVKMGATTSQSLVLLVSMQSKTMPIVENNFAKGLTAYLIDINKQSYGKSKEIMLMASQIAMKCGKMSPREA